MKYYLLQKPEFFTGWIDIINFHRQLDYRAFAQDQMYRLPPRSMLQIRHREDVEYPPILLEPLPLWNEVAWTTIQIFMKEPLHTHLILLDEKTRSTYHYFCPALRRVSGKVEFGIKTGDAEGVKIHLDEPMPKDLPAVYVKANDKIQVLMRLDVLESLMRKGLCDMKLLPAEIMEG